MLKKLLKTSIFTINLTIFAALAFLIDYTLWSLFSNAYVDGKPVGGDYYNALTYLIYVIKYAPNPTAGWLPFWNEGVPIIGGYPIYIFYLLKPFANGTDLFVLMNRFSHFFLSLFFISSLALFWQVSKNWVLSVGLVFALASTRASYLQLTSGGYIISASIQWYLPLVLFFIYRFADTKRLIYLTAASIFCGLSLIHHAPSAYLMVFVPSTLALLLSPLKMSLKSKIKYFSFFLIVSTAIGAVGLYTLLLQTLTGSGTGKCVDQECWGNYPVHLTRWLNPIALVLSGTLLIPTVILILFKKTKNISYLLPALVGVLFCLLYATLAYLKLIDGITNVLFPIRIFWVFYLFTLTFAASIFYLFTKYLKIFLYIPATVITIAIFSYFQRFPVDIPRIAPNTIPSEVPNYAIPKFQKEPLSDVFPDWVLKSDKNFRFDITDSGLNQWYYLVSEIPSTRGYSNHPLGNHKDWQYFLEVTTRSFDTKKDDKELTTNRTKFLLDAYGVGLVENSRASYPDFLLADEALFNQKRATTDRQWYKLNPDVATPIVAAVSSPKFLFVGDDTSYNYFLRAIAMTNLNSKVLIPIKGPDKIKGITKDDLEGVKTVILYNYQDSEENLKTLDQFVASGGNIYIDSASPKINEKLPKNFPARKIAKSSLQGEKLEGNKNSQILKGIKTENFSTFTFKGQPWTTSFLTESDLEPWSKPVIKNSYQILLTEGEYQKGKIIWGGLNLPYHIVDNNNLEEAKLLNNILTSLAKTESSTPQIQVKRERPENIVFQTKDASGIYFKENYHSGWQANIEGTKTKVYKAGLDFMYVKIPDNLKSQASGTLTFKGNITTRFLYYLSIGTLVFAIIFLFLQKLIIRFAKITLVKLKWIFNLKFKKYIIENEDV